VDSRRASLHYRLYLGFQDRLLVPTVIPVLGRIDDMACTSLSSQLVVVLHAWDEHVLDASPDVEASGLRPGDSRRRVEQLCPQVVVLPARETLYQSHHESLKSVLAEFADRVATGALGEFFIEIGALSRTFPSESLEVANAITLSSYIGQPLALPLDRAAHSKLLTSLKADPR